MWLNATYIAFKAKYLKQEKERYFYVKKEKINC